MFNLTFAIWLMQGIIDGILTYGSSEREGFLPINAHTFDGVFISSRLLGALHRL